MTTKELSRGDFVIRTCAIETHRCPPRHGCIDCHCVEEWLIGVSVLVNNKDLIRTIFPNVLVLVLSCLLLCCSLRLVKSHLNSYLLYIYVQF